MTERRFHHAPSLRPHHQINPTVAVLCSLLSTPCVSVKKVGWFEKSAAIHSASKSRHLDTRRVFQRYADRNSWYADSDFSGVRISDEIKTR
jgi:hypothetical protein